MNNQEEGPVKGDLQLPPTVKLDGPKVRKIRESKGLTQLYVASSVGVTTDTISRWENKRYPTVKRENALKLTEVLEVDICDLLEEGELQYIEAPEEAGEGAEPVSCRKEDVSASAEASQPDGTHASGQRASTKRRILVVLILILLTAAASAAYVFFRPHGEFLEITATRFLPDHSAPGQAFPVIIDVYVRPEKQRTLLLKDSADQGIEFIKGTPAFTSSNGHWAKWIYQGKLGYTKFIYLARIKTASRPIGMFHFQGEVTIREQKKKSFLILGNNRITTRPYSWADINEDHIIDDEEILEAYDLLSGVKAAESLLKEVEILWSAGGYMWDINEKRFLPLHEGLRAEKNT